MWQDKLSSGAEYWAPIGVQWPMPGEFPDRDARQQRGRGQAAVNRARGPPGLSARPGQHHGGDR
jgi:hypothetical protein